MEDQYGIADLRQYINGKQYYTQPPDLLSCHRGVTSPYPYDMLMFRSDSPAAAVITPNHHVGASNNVGFQIELGGAQIGGDSGTARWPRQETLSLLEIRSRLDFKFKEANQKGPLWDEVSRIMSEEYGYQRSGKKCREKFENLYKYYKKTRDGKGGRQDGKHYRFFRQLEALYGDQPSNSSTVSETPHFISNATFPYNFPNNQQQQQELYNPGPKQLSDASMMSIPNSSDYDTVSSDCSDSNVDDARNKKRRGLKAKIRESIDEQMKKLMEKQESWMQKMMAIIEHKDQERIAREEQWRKQDAARIDREHKLWATERAWIQGRDVALMEAFRKLAGGQDGKVLEDGVSAVSNYLLQCKKRKEEDYQINDEEDSGDQGLKDCGQINDSSCFRYFVGDSYGRL